MNEIVKDYSSGAFKTVEIYDTIVVKRPKGYDGDYRERSLLSYSEAQNDSRFFDEDGVFQSYLLQDYNADQYNSSVGCIDENELEMSNEFGFIKRYERFPIFTPIVWGDETHYAMKKAKTFEEVVFSHPKKRRVLSSQREDNKLIKYIIRKAYTEARSQKLISPQTYSQFRVKGIVNFGLSSGMPIHHIIRDVKTFLMFDENHNLLGDMHSGNIGIYKGHIVTFDVGRADTNSNLKKAKRIRSSKPAHKNFFRFEEPPASPELEEVYVKILALKYNKTRIKYNNAANLKIKKVRKSNGQVVLETECNYWITFRSMKEFENKIVIQKGR